MTHEEEIALSTLFKQGNEAARERMINANLRLVVRIARDYVNLGLPILKTIRLPSSVSEKIAKIRQTALRLQTELQREPTDEAPSGEMGVSLQMVS